jgi:hypothetical protein
MLRVEWAGEERGERASGTDIPKEIHASSHCIIKDRETFEKIWKLFFDLREMKIMERFNMQ